MSFKITVALHLDGGLRRESLWVAESTTYEDLLEHFGINPETVVVLQGGVPKPFDDSVSSDGEIVVLKIVSGG
ncbi:hypothetical protein AIOGIFDO_00325 [Candidatus Methanoperedenaceae archaeon GB37]|nr:hypothetical protein AIOGIFDO_00325 [Candidatus Methanoperedenaceae archaeon GB37]